MRGPPVILAFRKIFTPPSEENLFLQGLLSGERATYKLQRVFCEFGCGCSYKRDAVTVVRTAACCY